MQDAEFDFEAEFALLDVGATSSLLKAGSLRPSVLGFTETGNVEAVALDWNESSEARRAFEEARRYLRDLYPLAYAVVAQVSESDGAWSFHLPGHNHLPNATLLGVTMVGRDGAGSSLLYPVRRSGLSVSFGSPSAEGSIGAGWCPLGDIWGNPFCEGDLAQFRPRDRAVEPGTPLWHTIVELTRMRAHDDPAGSDEYMGFLDDLRNGIFTVAGRPPDDPGAVLLRPRTTFNPLGTLRVEAGRLQLIDGASPAVDLAGAE